MCLTFSRNIKKIIKTFLKVNKHLFVHIETLFFTMKPNKKKHINNTYMQCRCLCGYSISISILDVNSDIWVFVLQLFFEKVGHGRIFH